MSVLDPMCTAWQRKVGQSTWDRVVAQTGLPVTNSIPFTPDGSMDKSPAHHLLWSYKSQVKRVYKSWRNRNSSGIAKRDVSRKVLDEAGQRWTHGLRKWLPADALVVVYDDLGVFRLMVKFADGQGPMIEGVARTTTSSETEWQTWVVGDEGSFTYGPTPAEAVLAAIKSWVSGTARAQWYADFWASTGHKIVSRDGYVQSYGRPHTWEFRTFDEEVG